MRMTWSQHHSACNQPKLITRFLSHFMISHVNDRIQGKASGSKSWKKFADCFVNLIFRVGLSIHNHNANDLTNIELLILTEIYLNTLLLKNIAEDRSSICWNRSWHQDDPAPYVSCHFMAICFRFSRSHYRYYHCWAPRWEHDLQPLLPSTASLSGPFLGQRIRLLEALFLPDQRDSYKRHQASWQIR